MLASSWQSKIYPAKFIPVNKYGFYDKHACDINIKRFAIGCSYIAYTMFCRRTLSSIDWQFGNMEASGCLKHAMDAPARFSAFDHLSEFLRDELLEQNNFSFEFW